MEVILVVGFALVSVYLVWKITKALVKTLLYGVLFLVCAYFGFTYFAGSEHRSMLDQWTERGADMVGETIEDARDITNEKMLEPLKDKVDPVRQLDDALNSGKKKRGVE